MALNAIHLYLIIKDNSDFINKIGLLNNTFLLYQYTSLPPSDL